MEPPVPTEAAAGTYGTCHWQLPSDAWHWPLFFSGLCTVACDKQRERAFAVYDLAHGVVKYVNGFANAIDRDKMEERESVWQIW